MSCEVEGFMGDVCRRVQSSDPKYCQAQKQAESDLPLYQNDPLFQEAAAGIEDDFNRTYTNCPQLDDVILKIRQELARRKLESNQPIPPGP